jgi:hypothetical protein
VSRRTLVAKRGQIAVRDRRTLGRLTQFLTDAALAARIMRQWEPSRFPDSSRKRSARPRVASTIHSDDGSVDVRRIWTCQKRDDARDIVRISDVTDGNR